MEDKFVRLNDLLELSRKLAKFVAVINDWTIVKYEERFTEELVIRIFPNQASRFKDVILDLCETIEQYDKESVERELIEEKISNLYRMY